MGSPVSSKAWRMKNPEHIRQYHTLWQQLNYRKAREYRRLSRTGLTKEQIDDIMIGQNYSCAICKSKDFGLRGPVVDLDHSCCSTSSSRKCCGRCVRGILCNKCNLLLGNANDSLEVLTQAIKYLQGIK